MKPVFNYYVSGGITKIMIFTHIASKSYLILRRNKVKRKAYFISDEFLKRIGENTFY
jgi:hypothetical protein